jgi:HK97 family phage major capsid protein
MSAIAVQSELRLARLLDEQVVNQQLHENLVAAIETSDDKTPTESQTEQIKMYREKAISLNEEIKELADTVEDARRATEASKAIRRALAGNAEGVDVEGDGIVYRSMAAYARDVIVTGQGTESGKIAQRVGSDEVQAALERLQLIKRTPANTLSSNVGGLSPPQHIDQIFQVIDSSRPVVASAVRSTLERGVLTYPRVDTRPVVAVQTTEKTEAGNTGMAVSMQTATASTYLGGGDLSWQAINWSTPDALDLWFRLAASDYALKTEQDAAQVMQHSGFSNNIASPIAGTPTFAQFMAAIGAGYAEVFANSGRTANTVYLAPDRFGYLLGLTSDAFTQFTSVSGSNVGPLNIVISRGMDAGVAVVGDSDGLLVAETAGAPVELRVVEPAIGGVEVGIIGAFEAVVVDNGAFAMITTAS